MSDIKEFRKSGHLIDNAASGISEVFEQKKTTDALDKDVKYC